jgi:hypothetical protein
MDLSHESLYEPPAMGRNIFPPPEAHSVWQRELVIRRQLADNPSTHLPPGCFALAAFKYIQISYPSHMCTYLKCPFFKYVHLC